MTLGTRSSDASVVLGVFGLTSVLRCVTNLIAAHAENIVLDLISHRDLPNGQQLTDK